MLRSFCLSLLGLALLAEVASAQTAPAANSLNKKTPAQKAAARRSSGGSTPADPARGSGTNDNGVGQSGYAAPGQPITSPSANGKNTGTYDGKPAKPAQSNTSLSTPK